MNFPMRTLSLASELLVEIRNKKEEEAILLYLAFAEKGQLSHDAVGAIVLRC